MTVAPMVPDDLVTVTEILAVDMRLMWIHKYTARFKFVFLLSDMLVDNHEDLTESIHSGGNSSLAIVLWAKNALSYKYSWLSLPAFLKEPFQTLFLLNLSIEIVAPGRSIVRVDTTLKRFL